MPTLDYGSSGSARDTSSAPHRFVFYIEGPSDRAFLRNWATRLSPRLARLLEPCAFILGGRQPARALEHFRGMLEEDADARGVCILDRDGHEPSAFADTSKLQLFTWPRRHIESYLLVPGAIARCAGTNAEETRTSRILRDHLPAGDDEAAFKHIDAKRLLAPKGSLSRALGIPLSVHRVARALRRDELHRDICSLFVMLGEGLGAPTSNREIPDRG